MSSTYNDQNPPCAKRARTMASGEALARDLSTKSIQRQSTHQTTTESKEAAETTSNSHDAKELPLAPQIQDYLAPGGCVKYRPRPEWLTPTTATVPRLRQRGAVSVSPWLEYATTGLMMNTVVDLTTPTSYEEEGDDTTVGVARAEVATAAAPQPQEPNNINSLSGAHNSHNPQAINNGLLPDDAFASFAHVPSIPSSLQQQSESEVSQQQQQVQPATAATSSMQQAFSTNSHPATPTAAVTRAIILTSPSSTASTTALDRSVSSSLSHPPSFTTTPRNLLATFGKEQDSPLNLAIKAAATDAALALLKAGAPVDHENAKGATPMILAAQRGNLAVVKALMELGANPAVLCSSGSTALIQAAHFGHREVIKQLLSDNRWNSLVDLPNLNQTTALMRASQEGHIEIVQDLLAVGADPNRRNRLQMTALMLASQRGEARIVKLLVDKGAHVDARTKQDSTSLLLSCKRGHKNVAQVLITAGCDLCVKDSRGRTAKAVTQKRLRDITIHRQRHQHDVLPADSHGDGTKEREMIAMLDSAVQVYMMQVEARKLRSLEIAKLWKLLQEDRAFTNRSKKCHSVMTTTMPTNDAHISSSSNVILAEAMSLPANIVELITCFLPLPHLWQRRIRMLTHRATSHPDAAVISSLDMVDEILEEGGFLEACDEARVVPPTNFRSWHEWKRQARECSISSSCLQSTSMASTGLEDESERPIVTLATSESPSHFGQSDPRPSRSEMRRRAGFLSILAHRTPLLQLVLSQPPYNMPEILLSKMIRISDLSSLVRRMGSRGIHFDSQVAMELVMLVSDLCSWYWRDGKVMSSSMSVLRTPV